MNKLLVATLSVLVSVGASAASPTPDSYCRVRVNGTETGQLVNWNEFFSKVANESRGGECTYGKIYHMENSGRVYSNGRKLGDNLSNAEAQSLIRRNRLSGCTEYSCDEAGIIRGNEDLGNEIPVIVIPGNGGY